MLKAQRYASYTASMATVTHIALLIYQSVCACAMCWPFINTQLAKAQEVLLSDRVGRLYKQGWPGCYIDVIHYKNKNISKMVHFQDFYLSPSCSTSDFTSSRPTTKPTNCCLHMEPGTAKNCIFSLFQFFFRQLMD